MGWVGQAAIPDNSLVYWGFRLACRPGVIQRMGHKRRSADVVLVYRTAGLTRRRVPREGSVAWAPIRRKPPAPTGQESTDERSGEGASGF